MRLATEKDVPYIDAILNEPSIRPHMGPGEGPLSARGLTSKMIFIINDASVFMGESLGDGEYLGVAAVLPERRGLAAVVAFRKALDMMFFEQDAFRILATVKTENRRSLRYLKALGFKNFTPGCGRIHAEMDFVQWALGSDACLRAGGVFVDILGRPLYEGEMRMLGAFVLTVKRSKSKWTGKAFKFFNRFAKLSQLEFLAPANEEWTEFVYCGKKFKITDNVLMGVAP
jgi:hypothetical protein